MKNILVVGSGRVSGPLVQYLLQHRFKVKVADKDPSATQKVIKDHPNGTAVPLDISNKERLSQLVGEADVVVSLLPYELHPEVATVCVDQKTHLVTSSYVKPRMEALDSQAKASGVILLNELGLDPGIDHMTAMQVIHHAQSNGRQVVSFSSFCGGLPAPEVNDNPFGYKFSWRPLGVFDAMVGPPAQFLQSGEKITIPNADLFAQPSQHFIDGVGALEGYPNRNSLQYIPIYSLNGIQNMLRGTLRNVGWCNFWHHVCKTNILDNNLLTTMPGNVAEFTAQLIGASTTDNLDAAFAHFLGLAVNNQIIDMARWLGLFSPDSIPEISKGDLRSARSILAGLAERKMAYTPGERDMSVMQHKFEIAYPSGKMERITSTLLVYGIPNGDTSMAQTVGLSAAIGARFIAEGVITTPGVQIPVTPEIYRPVLAELENFGIRMTEEIETVS